MASQPSPLLPPPASMPPPLRPYTNRAPFNTALQDLCNEHNTVLHRNYILESRIADLETNATTLLSGQSLQLSADLVSRVAGLRAGLQTTLDHSLAGMGRGGVEKGVEILAVVNELMARDGRMSEAMLGMLMKRDDCTGVKLEEAERPGLIEGLKGDVVFLGVHFYHVRKELKAIKTSHAASLSKQHELMGELGRVRKLAEAKEMMLVLRTKEKTGQDASLARHNKLQAEKTAALKEKDQQIQVLNAKVTEKENHVQNLNAKVTRLESEQQNCQAQPRAGTGQQHFSQSLRPTAPTYVPFNHGSTYLSGLQTQPTHQGLELELHRTRSETEQTKTTLQARLEELHRQKSVLASNKKALVANDQKISVQAAQLAELEATVDMQNGIIQGLQEQVDNVQTSTKYKCADSVGDRQSISRLEEELSESKEHITRCDKRIDKYLSTIEDLQSTLAERERYIPNSDSMDLGHESCQKNVRRFKDDIATLIEQLAIAEHVGDHTSCLADVKKCTDEIRLLGQQLVKISEERTAARSARDEANLNLHEMKTRWNEHEALVQSLREELAAATLVLEGMAAEAPKISRCSSPAQPVKAEPCDEAQPSIVAYGIEENKGGYASEQVSATEGFSAADTESTRSLSCAETRETLGTATSEGSTSDGSVEKKCRKRSEPASEVYLPPQKRTCGLDGADDAPETRAVIRAYDRKAFVAKWTTEWRPEAKMDY
ncbi:hypothetical protein B0A48_15545 [Cryoendolithus antarcticus]|uniref:Uncharacterized protein n=1 Tax=Cryoendolithus antarcticus TaxID=1507870 RepID=A0A1V8SGQ9_9PEZI|nr:hypothetical protein B0A48_15545 [Cryoendolithus antarcticus]